MVEVWLSFGYVEILRFFLEKIDEIKFLFKKLRIIILGGEIENSLFCQKIVW